MYMCMCACVCMCVHVCMCVCVYLHVCTCVHVSTCVPVQSLIILYPQALQGALVGTPMTARREQLAQLLRGSGTPDMVRNGCL